MFAPPSGSFGLTTPVPVATQLWQTEATEVFFSVTKLFQSNDIGLRRFLYLIIKEISPSADEVRVGVGERVPIDRSELAVLS